MEDTLREILEEMGREVSLNVDSTEVGHFDRLTDLERDNRCGAALSVLETLERVAVRHEFGLEDLVRELTALEL